ncbi:hypothetical protein [Photorhabdus australis]
MLLGISSLAVAMHLEIHRIYLNVVKQVLKKSFFVCQYGFKIWEKW